MDEEQEETLYVSDKEKIHDDFLIQNKTVSKEWFRKQYDFIRGLSQGEIDTLRSYTKRGDFFFNTFLRSRIDKNRAITKRHRRKRFLATVRNFFHRTHEEKRLIRIFMQNIDQYLKQDPRSLDFLLNPGETITKNNVLELVAGYVARLRAIVEKAPTVTQEMRLFRGIDPPYEEDDEKKNASKMFLPLPSNGMISTTYNPNTSTFGNYFSIGAATYPTFRSSSRSVHEEAHCCCVELILHKGVKCIWIEPLSEFYNENEVILLGDIVQISYRYPVKKEYGIIENGRLDDSSVKPIITYVADVRPIVGRKFTMRSSIVSQKTK
jgi:hypothetical protein